MERQLRDIDLFVMFLVSRDAENLTARANYAGPYKYGAREMPAVLRASFKVEKDERGFTIRSVSTDLGEKSLHLDRRLDLEFVLPQGGFLTIPYEITNLFVGSKGRLLANVSPDCSRKSRLEISMSGTCR